MTAGYSGTPLPRKLGMTEGRHVAIVDAPEGWLWVAWPKRASGVQTDLTENDVRDYALAAGLVDNKVAAIDETWSGLRLVVRRADRSRWPLPPTAGA